MLSINVLPGTRLQTSIGERLFYIDSESVQPSMLSLLLELSAKDLKDSDVLPVFQRYRVNLVGFVSVSAPTASELIVDGVPTAAWLALPKKP